MGLFDLSGRTALVTGSSRGLGRAMAEGLAEAGAAIVLNGSDPGRLAEAATAMRQAGHTVHESRFDVTDEAAVLAAFDGAGHGGNRGGHPGQQCRHPIPQADAGAGNRRLAGA